MVEAKIYDENDGIRLEFDMQNGMLFSVLMEDEACEDIIDIIRNKLNSRFGK